MFNAKANLLGASIATLASAGFVAYLTQAEPQLKGQFTLGNITTISLLIGGIWRLEKFGGKVQSFFNKFMVEHELLVRDYCNRQNPPIDVRDLSTRVKSGLLD